MPEQVFGNRATQIMIILLGDLPNGVNKGGGGISYRRSDTFRSRASKGGCTLSP